MALGNDVPEDILQSALDQAFSPPPSRRQSRQVFSEEAAPSSKKIVSAHTVPEDILQSALGEAFSPPPSRRQSVHVPVKAESSSKEIVPASTEPLPENTVPSDPTDDPWKAEYESQVEAWRAQSAEAREKAEKERQRWEAVRTAEKKEAESHRVLGITDEPQNKPTEREARLSNQPTLASAESQSQTPARSNPLPAESNELASSTTNTHKEVSRPHSQADDTGDESQKWEDIHASVTSSYPSLEYPERTETPSPSHRQPAPQSATSPLSATIAIFDSTLSTRTRVKALFSSVAINVFLPFVNGVMLGFGEIFAKNVLIKWLGWKPTGSGYVATTTGIGASVIPKTSWGERR